MPRVCSGWSPFPAARGPGRPAGPAAGAASRPPLSAGGRLPAPSPVAGLATVLKRLTVTKPRKNCGFHIEVRGRGPRR